VQQIHGLTEILVALVGPPPGPARPHDPAAPCEHPAARRMPFPTLAAPRRSFCRQCESFLEE